MTCIVGLVTSAGVFMGGDSAGVAGLDIRVRKDPKVFERDGFLIGYTSSFRMGQILRYNLKIPSRQDGVDPFDFMVTQFVPAVRDCLKDGGFASKDKDVESGGTFLVGFERRLFRIEDDYQVIENEDPFDAVGCGASFALGALKGAGPHGWPGDIILGALEVAAYFSAGVRAPFIVLPDRATNPLRGLVPGEILLGLKPGNIEYRPMDG